MDTLDTIESKLDKLVDTAYATRAAEIIPYRLRLTRRLNLHGRIVLWGDDQCDTWAITELARDAVDRGDISHDEVDELLSADIIIKGYLPNDTVAYVVFETAMTVAERDVEQAIDRANILQIVTGCTVRAAVVGETVTEAVRQRAENDGVEVFTLEMAR